MLETEIQSAESQADSEVIETAVGTQSESLEGQQMSASKDEGGEPQLEAQAIKEGTETQPKVQEFTPNLEFEVRGQKKKFDEKLKEIIKSKEHEDLIRDLYTKADGIDTIKEQREYIRSQFTSLQAEVNKVLDHTEKGDLKSALQSVGWDTKNIEKTLSGLGYSKREIIEHAYQLANLTPEQEQYQNQLRQAELERQELAKQNHSFQSQLEQIQVRSRQTELQSLLSKPDISPIVKAFDEAHGQNAFFQEVANRGAMYWHTRKFDAPAEQLVEEVLKFARHLAPQETPTQQQTTQRKKEDLPVIPQLGSGGGKAPVAKRVSSLAEMKRKAQSLPD